MLAPYASHPLNAQAVPVTVRVLIAAHKKSSTKFAKSLDLSAQST